MYSARPAVGGTAAVTVGDGALLLVSAGSAMLLPTYSGHGSLPWFAAIAYGLVALSILVKITYSVTGRSTQPQGPVAVQALSTLCQYLTIPVLTLVYCLGASSTSQPAFWPLFITSGTLLMLYGIQLITNDDPYEAKTHLLYTVTLNVLACLALVVRAVVYLAFPHHIAHPSQVCFMAIFAVVITAISGAFMTTSTKRIKLSGGAAVPRAELFKLGAAIAAVAMCRALQCVFQTEPLAQKFQIPG